MLTFPTSPRARCGHERSFRVVAKPRGESWVQWSMEHGSPDLPESLAQCQQRIGELEQLVAHQAAVIAQQQEMAVAYQEQLAQAAEQLRLLKRALFGLRRERYKPSPDQKLLFEPEAVEGVGEQRAEETSAEAESPRAPRNLSCHLPPLLSAVCRTLPLPPGHWRFSNAYASTTKGTSFAEKCPGYPLLRTSPFGPGVRTAAKNRRGRKPSPRWPGW